ncbi:MAG: hypothetical protein KatS3mg115_0006 [Candidatus Poribacteria bacterium]|nr:MAG: hypothetical protein KatS3mg115_0006 [Candidatus Poribacteria bacterium]
MTLVSELGVPACTVEKPIATEVRDWRQLCALQEQTRTKFAVCHQFRWYPALVRCQEAVRSGRLGSVILLDLSCGMNVSGQGTHILNYAMSLNGDARVKSVYGTATGPGELEARHSGPETTAAYLVFENGVRGLWTTGYVSPKAGDPATDYQHVRVAAYCTQGRVNWEEFGRWEIVLPSRDRGGPV